LGRDLRNLGQVGDIREAHLLTGRRVPSRAKNCIIFVGEGKR